jgi:hypothetical protein
MSEILETTLSEILVQLANFFGTTTAAIQAQLPHFLAEYGQYYTLTEMPWFVFSGTFIFIIVAGCWAGLYYGLLDETNHKPFVIVLVIIAIVVYFLAIGLPIITCLVAPEFVGVEALIKELKILTQS